jgi:beta-glucanase (GH16 family)
MQQPSKPQIHIMNNTTRRLVWSDDFDGNQLDYSKWECEVNAFGGGNGEQQLYTDDRRNVRVQNSMLILEAHEGGAVSGTTRPYSSGRVRTKHRGDWTYGRIEVRARIPGGRGLWPAIWLLPTDDHYGTWAASGEIDIMENKGHQPRTVTGALHFGGEWPGNRFVNHTVRRALWRPKFSEELFTYAIDWEPDRIQWLIDGQIVHERRPKSWRASPGSNAPYDQRFHLLLNLAVGGHFPGPPDTSTRFPARMEIDWVKVWQ